MIIFETNNIKRTSKWLKRSFFISMLYGLIYFSLFRFFELTELPFFYISLSWVGLILLGQFDEVTITESSISIGQSSIISLLRTNRTYQLSDLIELKKNGNYTESDGDYFFLLLRTRRGYELNFVNGEHEIIDNWTFGRQMDEIIKALKRINKTIQQS